ncbi:MAG: Gldg family protein [Alphaproteobacteria bacterium]
MKQTLTVFKYEFLRYFNTPTAFVYLIAFLLLNGSCAFYLGNLLERGIADLLPMFNYIPWLFLFFIPAISMRLWSEEFKSKTIYQTLSLPVSTTSLTIGKFLSAWAFCGLGLILTFEFWITLNLISTPDNKMILSGYIASLLLSGALVAIGLFASSITKNQVIALLLGISLTLFFFLSGLDFVLGFYKMFLDTSIVDILASFSVLTHYSIILSGLIEIKAILYFISLILLFNFLSIISIKAKFNPQNNYKFWGLIGLLAFLGCNLIFSNFIKFIDNTETKKHSLSYSTKEILSNLTEPVNATLYYSQTLSNKNPQFRELFNSTKSLLKQYEKLSNNKFKLNIIHPQSLSQEEDIAIASGLKGLPILDSNQTAFFGLILTDALDNKEIVELFTPNNQDFLEPLITQKIYLLNHKKSNLGIITDLDIFENVVGGIATQNWKIIDELSSFYNIKRISNDNPKIENISALMIIGPQNFNKELSNNIKEYKSKSGKFLILLDPSPEAIRNFAPQTAELKPSNFAELEKDFGFRFIHQVFAADLDNSLTVDASNDYSQNPIITQDIAQIMLKEENLNQQQNPTAGLKNILLSSASIIAPIKSPDFEFIPLITTSKNSALMSSEYLHQNINPAKILANFKKDDYKKILAAKIIGKKVPFQAIVIADSDFIYDSYLSSTNNLYLILNALDGLMGNHRLLTLRAKSNKIYRLNKIEDLRKQSQLNYAVNEAKLLEKISQSNFELQKINSKKEFEERTNFIADELALMAKLRKNLEETKTELGVLKTTSYKKLEKFNNIIKLTNIYLLPLIILFILLIKYKNSTNYKQKSIIKFNKKNTILTSISLIILTLGILSHLNFTKNKTNELIFPQLNITNVDKIIIEKDNKTIELYKLDNKWQIKSKEGFMVYNKRIDNLLTAISFSTYYEQKSQKIENLQYFGLNNEERYNIQLFNQESNIANFYIGKYDINLGRGARGAYYRNKDNYDVWLIKTDLIDINPNWQEFSYSTLWNLRFGKAIGYEAEDIKNMINTPLLSAHKQITKKQKEFNLDIKTDEKPVNIGFYKSDSKYFIKYNFNDIYYEISKENFEKLKKITQIQ